MKQNGIYFIIFLLLLLLNLQVLSETKALIIGVGEYKEDAIGDLPTAINDARELASTLMRLGVVREDNLNLLINPGYTDMVYAIIDWIESADEEDNLFFYFGGHSEQAQNENNKTDTFLLPADFRSKVLTRTAYNFRQEWEEELSDKIKAKETIMIFDTCYSGGITQERSLQNLSFKKLGFENIAKDKGVNFLFSSQAGQTSKEMPESQGGWFTYHLLQGLGKGEANYDQDRYIRADELSKYVQERVSASTNNEQIPISIMGKGDMRIVEDEKLLYEKIKTLIVTKYLLGEIKEEHSKRYIEILEQPPVEDNEQEALLRKYLKKYYDDMDIIALEGVTDKIISENEQIAQDSEDPEADLEISPQTETQSAPQPQESTQRQGTCYLKLTAGNEQAKGAQIYIDGEYAGTLETGTILIERLTKAIHTITIDGEKIEREEIEITFDNDYIMVTQTIAAQTAKRKLLILTNPPGATLEINGTQQNEKTPVMIEVTIEQEHHIKLTKDGYLEKELTVKEETKGEPKRIETTLIANKAPNPPILIAPTGNQEDTTTTLKWYGTDPEGDAVSYEIYLTKEGQPLEKETEIKATTNAENSYTLTNLKSDTNYNWQVIAKDAWRETKGSIWQFKTKTIVTKQIKIETSPANAQIYINDKHIGTSPLTIELKEGSHTIEAKKEGYETKATTTTIGSQTKDLSRIETITMTLEKETGSIYFSTVPNGANIYLNGNYKGTTPKTIEDLEPNTYTLKITKTGYEEKTETVQIEPGKTKEVEIELTEKQEVVTTTETENTGTGYLKIEGNTGRQYYIDGENKGWIIPKEIKLSAGKHIVEIEGRGQTKIEIKANTTTIIDHKIEFGTPPHSNENETKIRENETNIGEMVLVKAGTFKMGNTRDDSEGWVSEKPVHIVKLTYDYYIGKYEVTFNDYDAYCEDMGKSKSNDSGWGRGNRPVINVSWYDAIKYCNWLSEKEGLSKAYDSDGNLLDKNGNKTTDITKVEGYRLPTEAEWEYAARGGHKSTSDFKFAGSNTINSVAWHEGNSTKKTHVVGQKAPNELGIYDMSGNVWEWCHDYWDKDYYEKSPRANPINFNNSSYRIWRGGAWNSSEECRVAFRVYYNFPYSKNYNNGLRIARTRK